MRRVRRSAAGMRLQEAQPTSCDASRIIASLFCLLFLRPLPALAGLLRHAAQGELAGRRVFADGGAGADGRARAHGDGRDQLRIRTDEGVVFDDGLVFIGAVVIAGDGARTDIDASAYRRVADVTQVIHLRTRADLRFFHLDEIADVHVVGEHRAGTDAREGPDARACAYHCLLDHRVGLYVHTIGYRHVAQVAIGADDDVVADCHPALAHHVDVDHHIAARLQFAAHIETRGVAQRHALQHELLGALGLMTAHLDDPSGYGRII